MFLFRVHLHGSPTVGADAPGGPAEPVQIVRRTHANTHTPPKPQHRNGTQAVPYTHAIYPPVGRGLAPGKMPGILPVPQRAAEGGGPYECTVEPVVGDGALDGPAEPVQIVRRTHANTHTPRQAVLTIVSPP